jgi:type VI secretion system protein ImpH
MLAAALARLLAEPWRFGFDAAVRLLMRTRRQANPADAARFRTQPGMAYPPADITRVTAEEGGRAPELTVTMGGLTGPSGVLPRYYSEQVVQQVRGRADGLHTFLDMLGHRMLASFAQAGIKYRPARSAEQAHLDRREDPHRGVLLALVGEASPALRRPEHERDTLLYYSGLFTAWPRSADRLEAMLSDWMGHAVTVRQFEGTWLILPEGERTRLPRGRDRGRFTRLGHDAAIGERSWDPHGRVVIRIDGLSLGAFRDLLPDRTDAGRLLALVRAYLGPATDFAINPALARDQVPPCGLGGAGRLGWDTWLAVTTRHRGGDEARFGAGLIERRQAGRTEA